MRMAEKRKTNYPLTAFIVLVLVGVLLAALSSQMQKESQTPFGKPASGLQDSGKLSGISESESSLPQASSTAGSRARTRSQLAFCGDGFCDADESCFSCTADCGCSGKAYCASSGVCKPAEFCGDNVCTQTEKQNANCCGDCGCGEGQACDFSGNACLNSPQLDQTRLKKTLEEFAGKSGKNYTSYNLVQSVVNGKVVNTVIFHCETTGKFVCAAKLELNETGDIVRVSEAS